MATLFAWRLASRTGLGALISSKVNQWTLLVGSLPIVFSIFAGVLHGLPLDTQQRVELFVTAAQSVFAVAIVASRSVSRKEAWVMLGLFVAQIGESLLAELGHLSEQQSAQARIGVGVVFLIAAAWVLRQRLPGDVWSTCGTGCARRGASSPPKSTSRSLRTPSIRSGRGRIFG